MTNNNSRTEQQSFVTCGPDGHYNEACRRSGFAKSGEYLVVDYELWIRWYNKQRYTNEFVRPPRPVFNGLNYQAATKVASELTQEVIHIELRNEKQYAINQQNAPISEGINA